MRPNGFGVPSTKGERNVMAPVPHVHHSERKTEILSTGSLSFVRNMVVQTKTETPEQARAVGRSQVVVWVAVVAMFPRILEWVGGRVTCMHSPHALSFIHDALEQTLTQAIRFTTDAHRSLPTSSATLALRAAESFGTGGSARKAWGGRE